MRTHEIIEKAKWNIDPVHSVIGFKVKHLLVAGIRGEFKEYTAGIYTRGDDFLSIEIDMRINPASVSTGDASRDAHLKGADFFNAEVFREINFRATHLERTGSELYVLRGDLTMNGISKEILLDVEFEGVTKSPGGDKRAYFMVTGRIKRKDWELTWSAIMESGGFVVGEEVLIKCEIELIRES